MSLRIRSDGRVLCAAIHAAEPGDTYIDDGLHYQLSVVHKVLVTEAMPAHAARGEWWWRGQVPDSVTPEEFYMAQPLAAGVAECGNTPYDEGPFTLAAGVKAVRIDGPADLPAALPPGRIESAAGVNVPAGGHAK